MSLVNGATPYPGNSPAAAGFSQVRQGEVPGPNRPAPRDVAEKFETLFVSMLLKEMKKSLPGGTMLPGASGGFAAFETVFDQHLADALSVRGTGMAEAFARMMDPNRGHSGDTGLKHAGM